MKFKPIPLDYLKDILDSIASINDFLKDIDYGSFCDDKKTQQAVIRALEIIGEAAKKIPQEMRDKLIHDYFGVDIEVVWNTATNKILALESDIKNILSNYQYLRNNH